MGTQLPLVGAAEAGEPLVTADLRARVIVERPIGALDYAIPEALQPHFGASRIPSP